MSLEAVFGDSNASKGIVICHSLHWYRYTGKTGQQRAAQHLIEALQSLNTLLEQHGLQGLPAMGSCEFSDNSLLGMTHESYNSMRREGGIFEIHRMFSSCFEYSFVILKLNLINTFYFPKERVLTIRKKENCPSISRVRHTLSSSPYPCEDQLDGLKHKLPHALTDIDPSLYFTKSPLLPLWL